MDFTAKHIGFVLVCYGISAVLLLAITLIITLRARGHDRKLASLEQSHGKLKK